METKTPTFKEGDHVEPSKAGIKWIGHGENLPWIVTRAYSTVSGNPLVTFEKANKQTATWNAVYLQKSTT